MPHAKLPIIPSAPEEENWDVVVVGTGMGGSTLGFSLARRGFKVLFLEKGHYLFGEHDRSHQSLDQPETPAERLDQGLWPVRVHGQTSEGAVRMFAPLGCGTGGSSGLYAAQLERMLPADFEPRRHHAQAPQSTLPETWPIRYEELLPYYRQAETIFDVCGTPDPLNPDPESSLREPPAISERDGSLMEHFTKLGLHPYRAHVGCRYVPGCLDCGGMLCPKDCKTDAGRVCLQPAVLDHGARLLPDCEVTHLEADAESVQRVHFTRGGQAGWVRGKVVVVAAGALMTPTLLLRSTSDHWPDGLANRSGQVGRNLMMHTSDFVAVRPPEKLPAEGPAKALSLNDLYVDGDKKLGTFQSVGIPVSTGAIEAFLRQRAEKDPKWYLRVGKVGRKVASHVGAWVFNQASVFATVVEDLPYADNRVVLDDSAPNGMRFEYRYPDELLERNHHLRAQLGKRLSPTIKTMVLTGDNNLNYGHTSGTCRSGDDPLTSVLDRNNRCHDVDNLYVADASAFPSSGGTNPSLTIAANALRVADAIAQRL